MIAVLSVCACLLTMVGSVLLARGKLPAVYLIGVVNGLAYTALNVVIALRSEEQRVVLLLAVPSLWGAAMSVCGLRRLATAADSTPRPMGQGRAVPGAEVTEVLAGDGTPAMGHRRQTGGRPGPCEPRRGVLARNASPSTNIP